MTTDDDQHDAFERRSDGGAGDDDDGVTRHEQPDEHARLEHDRHARQDRPQHGVDALHRVEQPREELVHTPSSRSPTSRSTLGGCPRLRSPCRSTAGAIRHPCSPRSRLRRRTASGWMPDPTRRRAGAGSARAWSKTQPERVRAVSAHAHFAGRSVGGRTLPRGVDRLARLRGCRRPGRGAGQLLEIPRFRPERWLRVRALRRVRSREAAGLGGRVRSRCARVRCAGCMMRTAGCPRSNPLRSRRSRATRRPYTPR